MRCRIPARLAKLRLEFEMTTADHLIAGEGAPKTKKLARSEPLKKVAARRPTAPVNDEHANRYSVQAAAPVTRVSLLDIIKERLGQSPFKLN
jgi:hypothetical protein